MYVAINRKPENGCEIQNAACARSGIMLNLSVVVTAEHHQAGAADEDAGLPHGAAVAKKLLCPWAGSKRVVCADSYFASVATALLLLSMGLRFIGVVKTSTRGYPMGTLSGIPLQARGQHVSYTHSSADGLVDMMAVVWVDRERRYFIATTSTTLPGTLCERVRWPQVGDRAERVAVTVEQPQLAEVYYMGCASIDRHNRCRQNDLQFEHKHVTHDWSMRVNLSLLGICIVDAWMLYAGAQRAAATLTQAQFYEDLAEQLIDNTHDSMGASSPASPADAAADGRAAPLRYGLGLHLTPTLKRRKGATPQDAHQCAQRSCRECKTHRTTAVCSRCRESNVGEVFFCGPKTGRQCFDIHMREVHQMDV